MTDQPSQACVAAGLHAAVTARIEDHCLDANIGDCANDLSASVIPFLVEVNSALPREDQTSNDLAGRCKVGLWKYGGSNE
ncbi:hypothetical protein [Micromonospora sp. WMMD1082]|uniref:hypothetical protein n=1 Tax=Micromonospora sp. WMMD1082 TaxID=3016104 RepID=UPI0024171F4E|nr:hypothetical protein [Micromonospora sp. WMMD1082]MDG4795310.1 hypothetical protein [Micromonospora sp. WMMD1082]